MPNIDTSKVKVIAGEMIDINNRYKDDFSAVEQAINRLRTDWQQPQKVSSAAFACFDEIKAKFFEPSITERRELAQFLCDAVGIGYEEAENTNKKILEDLFDVIATIPSIVGGINNANSTSTETASSQENINSSITVDEFNKRVEQLKNKNGFTHGTPWGKGIYMRDEYIGKIKDSWECCAMARMMQYEIFGKAGTLQNNCQSFDDIRVGDVVYMNKIKGGGDGTTKHYVFVIEKGDDYIKVGEGNAYAKNYGTGCVSWGNTINKNDIIQILQVERVN